MFPELKKPGSPGDREASLETTSRVCELIMRDLISLYDAGLRCCGQGVLSVRLSNDQRKSEYIPADDIRHDMELAADAGDTDIATFLDDVLTKTVTTNPDRAALLMLVDTTSARVYRVDREDPTSLLKPMLEDFANG